MQCLVSVSLLKIVQLDTLVHFLLFCVCFVTDFGVLLLSYGVLLLLIISVDIWSIYSVCFGCVSCLSWCLGTVSQPSFCVTQLFLSVHLLSHGVL